MLGLVNKFDGAFHLQKRGWSLKSMQMPSSNEAARALVDAKILSHLPAILCADINK